MVAEYLLCDPEKAGWEGFEARIRVLALHLGDISENF
jgi:hypothetical protein